MPDKRRQRSAGAQRQPDPTPGEIRFAASLIRRGWSFADERTRLGQPRKPEPSPGRVLRLCSASRQLLKPHILYD